MFTEEQLRAMPEELAKERERIARVRPDRSSLTDLRSSLESKKQMLEGLMETGTIIEQALAHVAFEAVEETEEAIAEREHDAELVQAREEIDNLNMEIFLKYICSKEPELRTRVVLKAAEVDFEATIPLLKERLVVEDDMHVYSAIVKAVGLLGRDEELAFLSHYLSHEDGRVRANAIEGMNRCDKPSRFNLLAAMIGDENHRVRLNAAIGLKREDPSALQEVIDELWDADEPEARRAIFWAAKSHLDKEEARLLYLRGLEDDHIEVRLQALDCLGDCHDFEVAQKIVSLLEEAREKDEWTKALRQRLFALQASTDSELRAFVNEAIDRLLSTPHEEDIAEVEAEEIEMEELVEEAEEEYDFSSSLPASQRKLRPPKNDGKQDKKERTIWIRLAGRVVHGVKKDPLNSVTIRLSNTGYQEMSDRHGRFCFERLEANKVHIFVCEKTGWPNTTFRYRSSGQRDQRVIIRMRSRGGKDYKG